MEPVMAEAYFQGSPGKMMALFQIPASVWCELCLLFVGCNLAV